MIELAERIGAGQAAEIFAVAGSPGRVAKLYRDPLARAAAFREGANLALAAEAGLPVPVPHGVVPIGDRWAVLMDRAAGRAPIAAVDPDGPRSVLEGLVALQQRLHHAAIWQLPPLKARLRHRIGRAPGLPHTLQVRLLDRLDPMPDGTQLCHGDFHPWNVAVGDDGAATVLDWLDASCGDPAADVARSAVLLAPLSVELAGRYIAAYTQGSATQLSAIQAWLPLVAAARLAENVPEAPLLQRLAAGENLF